MAHNIKVLKKNRLLDSASQKVCTSCEVLKHPMEFGKVKNGLNTRCKECIKLYHILKTFGLSKSQYNSILKYQGNMCKICDTHVSKCGKKGLVIDHDHKSGKIRGLLCSKCNASLGLFKEDLRIFKRAMDYLSRKTIAKIYNPNTEGTCSS